MNKDNPNQSLFTVTLAQGEEHVLAAVERGLQQRHSPLAQLPTLTNVALGDPYLAEQLASLHQHWELRPPEPRGLLARLRARLAWRLLGPEIEQINATHATLVRLADSLVVQLDEERSSRRRIEEHLAGDDRLAD
jgi:hypothetical protein